MVIKLSNNIMTNGGAFISVPEGFDQDIDADGNKLYGVKKFVEVRSNETGTRIEFPKEALEELLILAQKSKAPVEEIVNEFVHRQPVIDHIKKHGYDIAQVALALVSFITPLLGGPAN